MLISSVILVSSIGLFVQARKNYLVGEPMFRFQKIASLMRRAEICSGTLRKPQQQ